MYTIKNCYYKNSKLDEDKFKQLVKHFAMDLSASDTARAIGISVRSVNDIFLKIREKISKKCEHKLSSDEVSNNHFFIEEKVINQQRITCSLCKTSGYIYTAALSTEEAASSDVSIYKKAYKNGAGYAAHNGAIIGEQQCANDIASFWKYSQNRLKKFKGIPKNTLLLHLKETEFRFNSRHLDLYTILLDMIEADPI